jgi:hypothetical protein
LSKEIYNINQEIENIEKWEEEKDEFGSLLNSMSFQKDIIKKNKAFLENLKNSKNKEKIEDYNKNLKEISNYKKIIFQTEQIILKINNFIKEIQEIDKDNIFLKPNLTEYKENIVKVKLEFEDKISKKFLENDTIKKDLSEN